MKKITLFLIFFFNLTSFSLATAGDWLLNTEKSNISYGTIKKNTVGESNHFKNFTGKVTQEGEITLLIKLSSVETWNETRNGRMKKILFKIAGNPTATLSGQIDMKQFKELKVGKSLLTESEFKFTLSGEEVELDVELVIVKLSHNKVIILPHEVLFLDADEFKFAKGLKVLQDLAGLPSISTAVPVTFYLTFEQKT